MSKNIEVGSAILIYNHDKKCWALPGGRFESSYYKSKEFARKMNRYMNYIGQKKSNR